MVRAVRLPDIYNFDTLNFDFTEQHVASPFVHQQKPLPQSTMTNFAVYVSKVKAGMKTTDMTPQNRDHSVNLPTYSHMGPSSIMEVDNEDDAAQSFYRKTFHLRKDTKLGTKSNLS